VAKKRSSSKKRKKSNKGLPALLLGGSVGLLVVFAVFLAIFFGLLFNYHFLVTDDGFQVVKKLHWGVRDTFADTRDWGFKDWVQHDEVGKALLNSEMDKAKKKWLE
jgi:hypothetical protein